jgi:hypothetical protein
MPDPPPVTTATLSLTLKMLDCWSSALFDIVKYEFLDRFDI